MKTVPERAHGPRILAMAVLAALSLTACQTAPTAHEAAAHWGYHGRTGPKHWGDLSPAYILCKTGQRQSPIDIGNAKQARDVTLQFNYRPSPLDLVNNGHTIKQNCAAGSHLKVNDTEYALKQFHVHSGSEHTVGGQRYAMEIHLVHQSEAGAYAVVGVLLKVGAENAFLGEFWDRLPTEVDERVSDDAVQLNPAGLLPEVRSCYTYDGSFTTPPGTEGVTWFLMSRPVELSRAQLIAFRKLYAGNFRPVQPLNSRVVPHLVK